MNSEWRTASLLDHYEVRSGLSKPAKDFGSGYPFLTFKDVFYNYFTPEHLGDFVQATEKEREGCSILRGDVFLTRTSETMHELGMSCVALRSYKDATFNGFCKRLRPKPSSELLPEYVGYYLRSPVFRRAVSAMSTMSTRASLNNEMIGRLEISFPPREVQVRISEILKSLDDRITLLRETSATLEAIAQALFKSWFVDFDPVRAKAEGRQPEGMDAATAALFPDSFEESELGLVPKGWAVRSIYEIARVIYGAPFASKRFNSEAIGIPLVRIRDLKDESPGVYTDEVHPKGYMIQPGDIVVGMDGEFRAYLWGGKPAWLNQRVCVFAPESGVPAAFVHRSISPLLAAVEASETATTVIHLGKNDIDRFRVVVPDAMVLAAFSEIVTPIYARIVEGKQTASVLTSTRDTLLPRLISGQLRLPEGEALIEEAV
ncbi:MAG: restriction endonuclease subunit S [Pseudomonas sp.]|uniref:restriction endonuclease subunit S n=1 Tax=Pseudomonas sp. TaxID=306 RepID=UPI001E0276C4|nr:restriction endonuclease subunit S [Pseudomonas sp.]MPS98020.1 restriction endonuclease subunit S [Pseudomonas sp.]